MRTRALLRALVIIMAASDAVDAAEVSLFNSNGQAVAYIDTDQDKSIYLWQGKPVAYLDGENIYGFNGKHLGWMDNGIVRDHDGNGVGFIQGAVNIVTQMEPLKGLEQLEPLKGLEELQPLKPLYTDRWSSITLESFLALGRVSY